VPRKSQAELTIVRPEVDTKPTRPRPPDSLNDRERRLFLDLINATAPTHFRSSDLPLLLQYVQLSVLAADASAAISTEGAVLDDGLLNPFLAVQTRAVRLMALLATRLRLSPQSRLTQRQASRQTSPMSYYERERGRQGDDDDA